MRAVAAAVAVASIAVAAAAVTPAETRILGSSVDARADDRFCGDDDDGTAASPIAQSFEMRDSRQSDCGGGGHSRHRRGDYCCSCR